MNTLVHRRLEPTSLNALATGLAETSAQLTDDHRRALAARFRAVPTIEHRQLDAWMVERAGQPHGAFAWSPLTARRTIANAALRRVRARGINVLDAVRDEIDELIVSAAAGYAGTRSLARWLAELNESARSIVLSESVSWAGHVLEASESLAYPWSIAVSDAFYDVASARTSLRGRRDVEITTPQGRLVVRYRAGVPGRSAGAGLRSDLIIDALSSPTGSPAARYVGVWPDAGVILFVDGTMENLRMGARDLVRSAVAWRRHRLITGG